jgi:hypothetical protein
MPNMAWIIRQKNGQVRWREEDRPTRTRSFPEEAEAVPFKAEVEAQRRDRTWKDDVRRQAERGR